MYRHNQDFNSDRNFHGENQNHGNLGNQSNFGNRNQSSNWYKQYKTDPFQSFPDFSNPPPSHSQFDAFHRFPTPPPPPIINNSQSSRSSNWYSKHHNRQETINSNNYGPSPSYNRPYNMFPDRFFSVPPPNNSTVNSTFNYDRNDRVINPEDRKNQELARVQSLIKTMIPPSNSQSYQSSTSRQVNNNNRQNVRNNRNNLQNRQEQTVTHPQTLTEIPSVSPPNNQPSTSTQCREENDRHLEVHQKQIKRSHDADSPARENPNESSTKQIKSEDETQMSENDKIEKEATIENKWNEAFKEALIQLESNNVDGAEVAVLTSLLQLDSETFSLQKVQIINDLKSMLNSIGVRDILMFGSTLTGLHFIQSDYDFHVELEQPVRDGEDLKRILNKAGRISRSPTQKFMLKCVIRNARVPIVRYVHKQTSIACDINFSSKNGYYNSLFIRDVLGFDERIQDLAIILKLWSKVNHLSDRMILSNYSLIIMLFFYLQNLPEPMLDSLKNIQQDHEPLIIDNKSEFNYFYDHRISTVHENTQDVRSLLKGFFEFYYKMNTNNYILCPYNGQLINRIDFDLHEDMDNYRRIVNEYQLMPLKYDNPATLILQDPFDHNLNIGIKTEKNVEYFRKCTKNSFQKCVELKDAKFSTLLVSLLKPPEPQESTTKGSKDKTKFQMKIHSNAGDFKVSCILKLV
jgi:DNA polymerase sigma